MSASSYVDADCSLDIRIFTPAVSPVKEKGKAGASSEEIGTEVLEDIISNLRDGKQDTIEEQIPRDDGTNQYKTESYGYPPNITIPIKFLEKIQTSRPTLSLDIPLAISTLYFPRTDDTTTPPQSQPNSPIYTNYLDTEYITDRQEHIAQTLTSLHGLPQQQKPNLTITTSLASATTTTPPLSPQFHSLHTKRSNLSVYSEVDVGDFKLTRRSLTSASTQERKKPNLMNLPPYIQAVIIHYLAELDGLDRWALRATCKRFHALIGRPVPVSALLLANTLPTPNTHAEGITELLACKDCLRLRQGDCFVDEMRHGDFKAGGKSRGERFCIECGVGEMVVRGRRIPPRLRKRTRLKVGGLWWVVCWYCGVFGEAPGVEETAVRDCCRSCFFGSG